MSVTGTIGNEPVDLINAATEDTLRQLLATMKTLNQSVLKIGSAGGGGGGNTNAANSAAQLGASLVRLNPAVAAVQAGFNILSTMVSSLTSRIGFVAGAFVNFGIKAMDGTAKMSDFFGSLSQAATAIPIFGGALGAVIGIFQKMAAFQEANMEQYQRLTAVGINFGGSLTNLRMAASNSYMSLQDFGNLMSANSKTFAKMGGTVNSGAEAFSIMTNRLMKSFGPELTAMGYTTNQVTQGLASYIEMTGGRNAVEMRNSGAVIASSAAYMEQLNGLAEITGKSREAQEEELKRQASNAAFEAKMQGMSEKEKEKAMAGLAFALATGGQGAAEAFQAEIMGVGPTTKAAQQYTALYSEAAESQRKSARMVTDSTKTTLDQEKEYLAGRQAQIRDSNKYAEQSKYAMSTMGGVNSQQIQETERLTNTMRQQTDEGVKAALAKKSREETEAAVMAKANLAFKEIGSMIMEFLTPVIKAFTPIMGDIVKSFKTFLGSVNLPALGKELGVLAKNIADYIQNVFSPEGRDKIVNDLKYYLQLIMIEIKKAIIPWYSDSDAAKDANKLAIEKANMDKATNNAQLKSINAEIDKNVTNVNAAKLAKDANIAKTIAENSEIDKRLTQTTEKNLSYKLPTPEYHGFGDTAELNNKSTASPEKKLSTGTLGTTGKLFENFGSGTQVELHGSEAVITPDQMASLVSNAVTASQNNNLQQSIQQLNNLTKEMLSVMKESSENIKRNVTATKSLNRNLFTT